MLNKIRCNSSSIFFDQLAVIRFLEDSFRGSRDSFNILWNSFDLPGFIRIFFVWYYFATIGFRSNFLFFKVLPISFAILLRVLFFSLFFPQWRMLRWFQIAECKLQEKRISIDQDSRSISARAPVTFDAGGTLEWTALHRINIKVNQLALITTILLFHWTVEGHQAHPLSPPSWSDALTATHKRFQC